MQSKQKVWACSKCSSFSQLVSMRDYYINSTDFPLITWIYRGCLVKHNDFKFKLVLNGWRSNGDYIQGDTNAQLSLSPSRESVNSISKMRFEKPFHDKRMKDGAFMLHINYWVHIWKEGGQFERTTFDGNFLPFHRCLLSFQNRTMEVWHIPKTSGQTKTQILLQQILSHSYSYITL